MNVIDTRLPGVKIIELSRFGDERGYFLESYQFKRYRDAGIDGPFVQDNCSRSRQGVLRGLHYQIQQPQGKLVSVMRGTVFDVAVDVRSDSPHFGEWVAVMLSEDNSRQLYIPPGFAHGFCVVSEVADFTYKCTDYYSPQHERSVIWNDPELAIEWPVKNPTVSEKDASAPLLRNAEFFRSKHLDDLLGEVDRQLDESSKSGDSWQPLHPDTRARIRQLHPTKT